MTIEGESSSNVSSQEASHPISSATVEALPIILGFELLAPTTLVKAKSLF